jgi:hypothetical protein
MDTVWNIIFQQGAEFQATVSVDNWPSNYPALSTATDWRLRVAQPGGTAFLTATTANYITLNGAKTSATIIVPQQITSGFPAGLGYYDLDIIFPGSPNNVIKRLISLGQVQTNIYAGST